jgi:pyruvate dehydrogenase E1 component beta subunit
VQRAADDPIDRWRLFEHKGLYGRKAPVRQGEAEIAPVGRATIVRPGADVTVVSTLLMADRSLAAAVLLAEDGIDVELTDPTWLRPLDLETISASVKKTERLLVVEEQVHAGGWGATVISRLAAAGVPFARPPRALSLPENLLVPYSPPLEDALLPTAESIAAAVRELVAGRS